MPYLRCADQRGFRRRLAADSGAAAIARRDLALLLADLEPEQSEVVVLLTSELVNNGVLHAGAAQGDWIGVDITLTDALIRVAVRDRGPGFEPVLAQSRDPLEPHCGLYLVDELADRWGVDADRENVVWFEIDRDGNHSW